MEPSKKVAKNHFKYFVLPRRTRDFTAEQRIKDETDKSKVVYRKVTPDEEDRAELYPICSAGLKTFSHFGIGIGIYFLQLLILFSLNLICGSIVILGMMAYSDSSYGADTAPFGIAAFGASAACNEPIRLNVTVGCSDGELECSALYRENCDLPYIAAFSDMIMSIVYICVILLAKLGESEIEEVLDESVQTASDYSVLVEDPDKDADNPDEWYKFFSRFGTVRYITITRKNNDLCQMIVHKHKISKKIEESRKPDSKLKLKEAKLIKEYEQINKKLEDAYLLSYPTCRVYVTFEYEEQQRLCLQELEVPDFYAMFDIKTNAGVGKTLFRDINVLDVSEPPEPDNIKWENVQVNRNEKTKKQIISYLVTFGCLIACYFMVEYIVSAQLNPLVLSVSIGAADAILPMIFEFVTDLSSPQSEAKKQSELQVRLFLAKLLLSTVFPYLQVPWRDQLSTAQIEQIILVQIVASFTNPILDYLDIAGYITRNCLSKMTSETQEEMNSKWCGSNWSLANKYTNVAKVVFVSLYYALLTPFSLYITMICFLLTFLVDRYLLLRKWKPQPMLDAKVARRLRQQAVLAVAAHLYVSLRFIYSWPMDEVYQLEDGTFGKADKYAPFMVLDLSEQTWHTDSQKDILNPYRIVFIIVAILAISIWILDPMIRSFHRMFFYEQHSIGESQKIPFSKIEKIVAYVPLVSYKADRYICSYIKDMKPKHKPGLIRPSPEDKEDLSFYVPIQHQPHVLSVVKYYGDDIHIDAMEGGKITSAVQGTSVTNADTEKKRIITNEEGKMDVEPVDDAIPIELLEKLQERIIEPINRNTISIDVLSPTPSTNPTPNTRPISQPRDQPSNVVPAKKTPTSRKVRKNRTPVGRDRVYPDFGSGSPMPGISKNDSGVLGSKPSELDSKKPNRVVLKPLDYAGH